ncbi:hypothetical protein AJ80_09635 [Polytolypa hystricis UAMH7299]|uniref:F-box domain-containing protein n=1 Tax=Polytolypa hystricis (strain UAMH7299) TaxID=1447883 RepID=A0A2B7WMM8_POLH7|nr:hypothetical protein AJ80_09635 [Polytolypa hystricis UAMH7299]
MERLPQELLDHILSYLGRQPRYHYPADLIPYVTISRRWQLTIERSYFQTFRISSTQLDTFANIFREEASHRKAFVKEIELDNTLPEERLRLDEVTNHQVFSDAIFQLFQVLETFGDGGRGYVCLLEVRHPQVMISIGRFILNHLPRLFNCWTMKNCLLFRVYQSLDASPHNARGIMAQCR